MTRWERAKLVRQAVLRPGEYFRCAGCGSWPWHKTWARIELSGLSSEQMEYAMPEKPLGGCCSGAD